MVLSKITVRQLNYFMVVAELGSLRMAAASLYVSQPTLSNQIAQLEREIGSPVFTRRPRGVLLTSTGRALLKEARIAVGAVSRAERVTRLLAEGSFGELRIATVQSLAAGIVPRALERWREDHPGGLLTLAAFNDPRKLELESVTGLFDLAIGPVPSMNATQLSIGREEFVVLLPRSSQLLSRAEVELRDLERTPWVLFESANGLSRLHTELFESRGLHVEGAAYVTQVDVAINLAVAGLGPTLVPLNVIPEHLRTLARPFVGGHVRELAVYTPGEFDALARSFIGALRDVVGEEFQGMYEQRNERQFRDQTEGRRT
ncbi:LysR family transcriptional regulator [Agromyces sp. NPDC058484]|uniref:LysR family transcriptional regulator n=1 Tax=Agromyces sp. NPDC058484 TaxID=3346524 RepID=UPI00365AC70B